MKARISKGFFGSGSIDALIIYPDCACKSPLALQLAPLEGDAAFRFDGDFAEPNVTHYSNPTAAGSVNPPVTRCSPEGGKACHFTIRRGVAYHRDDSKYPNAVIPLKEFPTGGKQ